MNFFERSAMKRIRRQVGPYMEPGEEVLDFDIGRNHLHQEVHVIATDYAVYVVHGGGNAVRFPYTQWVSLAAHRNVPGHGDILSWGLADGTEYLITFGARNRGLVPLVEAKAAPRVAEQAALMTPALQARGGYLPEMDPHHDEAAQGLFSLLGDQLVFVSDHGRRYEMPLADFRSFRETRGGIVLELTPARLFRIQSKPGDDWVSLFRVHGIAEARPSFEPLRARCQYAPPSQRWDMPRLAVPGVLTAYEDRFTFVGEQGTMQDRPFHTVMRYRLRADEVWLDTEADETFMLTPQPGDDWVGFLVGCGIPSNAQNA